MFNHKYHMHITMYLVLIITVFERAWRVQIAGPHVIFLLTPMHELIFDLMGLSSF